MGAIHCFAVIERDPDARGVWCANGGKQKIGNITILLPPTHFLYFLSPSTFPVEATIEVVPVVPGLSCGGLDNTGAPCRGSSGAAVASPYVRV